MTSCFHKTELVTSILTDIFLQIYYFIYYNNIDDPLLLSMLIWVRFLWKYFEKYQMSTNLKEQFAEICLRRE